MAPARRRARWPARPPQLLRTPKIAPLAWPRERSSQTAPGAIIWEIAATLGRQKAQKKPEPTAGAGRGQAPSAKRCFASGSGVPINRPGHPPAHDDAERWQPGGLD